MKAISDKILQNSLLSGSKKRLRRFRTDLRTDREGRLYDQELVSFAKEYSLDEVEYQNTLDYLYRLKDPDGYGFSQSLKRYEDVRAALMRFAEDNYTSFRWCKCYRDAVKAVSNVFKNLKLKSLSYTCDEDVMDALPRTDTHSGYSFIVTGKKKKGEYEEGIYEAYLQEEEAARRCGTFGKPILPGTRTQGSGAFTDDGEFTNTCKHKTRLISMIDIYVIIAELKFARPIQNFMASHPWYAGGFDRDQIQHRVNEMRSRWHWFMSLDYSSYDQSISNWLIEDAFSCLKLAFEEVDDELWNIIVSDFIHKNFIVPMDLNGGIIHSDKGVPSGSMFTQIIDTVVNWIMILTYLNSIHSRCDMIVMGDDNLFFTDVEVKAEDVSSYMFKNFGVKVNSEKTMRGDSSMSPEFLSTVWTYDGPYRHPRVLLSKMAYPERKRCYISGEVEPSEVLFGYYLTYPAGMRKLIDIDRFLKDYNYSAKETLRKVDTRYIPGALNFNLHYLSKTA